jgi:hypothetical protein
VAYHTVIRLFRAGFYAILGIPISNLLIRFILDPILFKVRVIKVLL